MKIMKSAIMLSIIASLLVSTFAFAPAYAPEMASLKAPTVVNPLQAPGSTPTTDLLVDDVVNLKYMEFTLYYDTDVLTATFVGGILGAPVWFDTDYAEINDAMGYVIFRGHRRLIPDGTDYFSTSLPLPIAYIIWSVDARGESPLDLQDTVLKNNLGEPIEHVAIDGLFDNTFEGILSAPTIVDETLEPGSYFDVYIYVDDVTKLWGWQSILSFDPSYLMAVDCEYLPPMTTTWTMPPYEIGPDYVSMAASFPVGHPTGLTTADPVEVARIGFIVLDYTLGTPLDIHDQVLASVKGRVLYVDVVDGSFANVIPNPLIALTTGFVEARKFDVSEDNLMTLTAQIKNEALDHGRLVKARFTVLDDLGNDALGYPLEK